MCVCFLVLQKWINNALHPLKGYFSRSWYTLYANSKLANLLFSMELNRRLTHNEIMVWLRLFSRSTASEKRLTSLPLFLFSVQVGETSPVCSPSNMIAVAVSPGRTKTALFKSLPNDIEGYVARIASQFFQVCLQRKQLGRGAMYRGKAKTDCLSASVLPSFFFSLLSLSLCLLFSVLQCCRALRKGQKHSSMRAKRLLPTFASTVG